MKLTMRLGVRSYDIIIKQGGLSRVGQLINLNRRVLVVSDTGVPEAYLKTVLAQCREGVPVVLPQGEGTKSLECLPAQPCGGGPGHVEKPARAPFHQRPCRGREGGADRGRGPV